VRQYGAPPFYGAAVYLSRFARLFCVCIVLATLAVWGWTSLRKDRYTARALVVLSDKQQPAAAPASADKSPDIRTRLNMVQVFQRDPEFVKNAIAGAVQEQRHPALTTRHVWPSTGKPVEYHFDSDLSGAALDQFARRAQHALAVSEKEGVLEISCRWPDRQAEDIVSAFYWAFHDAVVNFEASDSALQAGLLTRLLDDTKATERRIYQKLQRYRVEHGAEPPTEPDGGAGRYATLVSGLADLRAKIIELEQKRDTYAAQLKTIPPKIQSMEIRGRPTDTPLYLAAMQKRNAAQQALDTLKVKYQDKHPLVIEAQHNLDVAAAEFKQAEAESNAKPNVMQQTTIPNPEYDRTLAFVNTADADLKGMKATLDLRQKQVDAEKRLAIEAGVTGSELQSLKEERDRIRASRAALEAQLQAATVTQQEDQVRAAAQTSLLNRPFAESESAGAVAALTFLGGPLAGLLIALLLSMASRSADHTLRTPLEVGKRLGKPVLAVLPKQSGDRLAARQRLGPGERDRPSLPSA